MIKRQIVLFLILVILSSRLPLFNSYANDFFGDERHYSELINALNQSSANQNYMIAVHKLFSLNARPGLGLLYYPAALLEWKNPGIPFGLFFNLIINSFSIALIYLIIQKAFDKKAAFLAALFVAFSITSLIYMRHLIPYDLALFLFLMGLYIYVYFNKLFIFGLFAGLSFLTYPGYYYYLIPLPFIFFGYYRSLKKAFIFLFGFGIILLLTQFFSLLLGETTTYFKSLKYESTGAATVNYGEFIPAASYISEYILSTDGLWNIFLLLVIFPGLFLTRDKKRTTIFIYLVSIFIILEVYSNTLQKTVLFGRTIRPFYLATLILSALVLESLLSKFKNKKYYFFGMSILIVAALFNFLPKFFTFKNLIYPKEFKQKSVNYLNSKYGKYILEDAIFVNYWDTKDPLENFYKSAESGKFYTVNAVQMFPYFGSYNLDRFCNHEILLKEPHIQYIFKPYLFEGHKRIMRERMNQDPLYYFLIYCKNKI